MIMQQLLKHYGPGVDNEPLVVYIRSILLRRCMLDAHGACWLRPVVRVAGLSPTWKQLCTGDDTTSSFQLLWPGQSGVRSNMQNHLLFLPAISLTQINPHTFMIIKLRNVYRKFLNSEWTLYRQWFAGVSRAILHMDDFSPVKRWN